MPDVLTDPLTVDLRPIADDDVPALMDLTEAAEAADATGEHYTEAELHDELANPAVDRAHDYVGAFAGEVLVGYFGLMPRSATPEVYRVGGSGTVHPDHRGRGVGTALVTAMVARARQIPAAKGHPDLPVRLAVTVPGSDPAGAELLASVGVRADRYSFGMRAQLDALADQGPPTPDAGLPPGYELRTSTPDLDEAFYAAHNVAFLDHPGWSPWTREDWVHWVRDSHNTRHELSLLAVVPDPDGGPVVAGYVHTAEFEGYQQATGRREAFVSKVGVRPEHRGRGIAGALLRETLRRSRAAGYDEAALDVDSENPTGALGLYERAGFHVTTRWVDHVGVLPPA